MREKINGETCTILTQFFKKNHPNTNFQGKNKIGSVLDFYLTMSGKLLPFDN
jgi:hypothetical protein